MAYCSVAWEVGFTDEFLNWWSALSEEQQDDVAHSVRHLIEFGPALGFPFPVPADTRVAAPLV